MQIDLPVHQSPGHQEFFNRVDAFLLYHQFVVYDCEHFDDAFAADFTFRNAAVKTVPSEVVHAVHVELRRDQLVQKFLGVVVVENRDGCV